MKLFFLFLFLLVDVPDWYNEIDKIVEEIDSNSTIVHQKEFKTGDQESKQICYFYKSYSKTKVILTDSSTSTNMVLTYYSNKKKVFAFLLQMDTHYFYKGIHNKGDSNRYYEETLIYFKSKDKGVKLKQSFYYNDAIPADSLNTLKSANEYKSEYVARKELETITKNLKRIKYKCS
jgi:hypothetical protein